MRWFLCILGLVMVIFGLVLLLQTERSIEELNAAEVAEVAGSVTVLEDRGDTILAEVVIPKYSDGMLMAVAIFLVAGGFTSVIVAIPKED